MSQCVACFAGYFLNSQNNSCDVCPNGCQTCSSSSNCLSCDSGYVSTVQSADSPLVCQACQSPCLTCFMNPQTCLTCNANYTLVGWTCVTKFNFGFMVELDTNSSAFFSNYYAFLEQMAEIFGTTNINDISMSSIRNGSIIAEGNASLTAQSVQSNASLNYTYTNFSDLLAQGSTIAGMQVMQSMITVNGGTIPDADDGGNSSSGPNLALILGICIPVGLIRNSISYL